MPSGNPDSETQHTRRTIWWVISVLCLTALGIVIARSLLIGSTHLSGGDRLWRLGITVNVQGQANQTTLQLYPPLETPHLHTIERTLNHTDFRVRNRTSKIMARNTLMAFASRSGRISLTSESIIHQQAEAQHSPENKKTVLNDKQRELYLRDSDILQITHPQVTETLQTIRRLAKEQVNIVEEIFSLLRTYSIENRKDLLDVPAILLKRRASELDRTLAMVALCRAAGFPSRIVSGLILREDIEPQLHYWVEVYSDDRWFPYDISAGHLKYVPPEYLPLRYDGIDTVQVLNGELIQVSYDIEREYDHPYLRQFQTRSPLSIFDLERLPVDARNELVILLLLPFGVLVTALCRHLVGIHSYGVFTPTLLALAMVYTNVVTTLVIFLVISLLAITGRSFFPAVITRVPRLAIIFTLIALLLTMSASVMDYFEFGMGDRIILLPIIILTSLVDRLYRTIEDKGKTIAMHRLTWTLLITLLCLPVIQFDFLGQLLLGYPEIHFFTLALFLLIANYKGKQLLHLPIIRLLAEPESKKPDSKNKGRS